MIFLVHNFFPKNVSLLSSDGGIMEKEYYTKMTNFEIKLHDLANFRLQLRNGVKKVLCKNTFFVALGRIE